MRHCERGSSQVPLVICIILLLVAGLFAYNQYGDREALQKRLNDIQEAASTAPAKAADTTIIKYITDARGTYSQQQQRLEEILKETGCPDTDNALLVVSPKKLAEVRDRFLEACDKGEFVIDLPVSRYIEDPSSGVIKVSEGAGVLKIQYTGTRELRQAHPDMTNVLDGVVIPGMRRMVSDIKRLSLAYGAAVTARDTAEAKFRETLAEKDKTINEKIQELAALENRKAQVESDLRRQLQEAEAAKATAEKEKTDAVSAAKVETADWRKKAEQAGSEVMVLKQKKRTVETDTSADGKVVTADASQSIVVVDLGRANNNLPAGLNFEVYYISKGGREVPKGTIKVKQVDATTSTAVVLELFDAYNPIAQGDLVRSLIYSPKDPTHVAMVGRFSKMGKSDAARRLESLGVIVDDKVTTATTYLVVGAPESEAQPIEDTAEYKTATLYGIPFLSEKELSRLTMY